MHFHWLRPSVIQDAQKLVRFLVLRGAAAGTAAGLPPRLVNQDDNPDCSYNFPFAQVTSQVLEPVIQVVAPFAARSSSKTSQKGRNNSPMGGHFLRSTCLLVALPFADQQLQQQIDGACSRRVLAAVEALVRPGRQEISRDRKSWETVMLSSVKVYGLMLKTLTIRRKIN